MALKSLRNKISAAFCLQAAACAVVAWSVLHGGIRVAPPARPQAAAPAPGAPGAPAGTAGATTPLSAESPASATAPGVAAPASLQLAASPALDEARPALSSIDIIVSRNDSLDRIFRRLRLNLADLASLRSLPGLRVALDSLRPGELLHFKHHDGELFGLERRLNESETLKVSREPSGLKADVVQNPLQT